VRADPGRVGLKGLLGEFAKLKHLRDLALPAGILKPFHAELVRRGLLPDRVAPDDP